VFAEEYANRMLLPVVRLLDGASGGGSVTMAQDAGYTYVPVNPAWDMVVDNLSVIPVVALCLGPTVGLSAGAGHVASGRYGEKSRPAVHGGAARRTKRDRGRPDQNPGLGRGGGPPPPHGRAGRRARGAPRRPRPPPPALTAG